MSVRLVPSRASQGESWCLSLGFSWVFLDLQAHQPSPCRCLHKACSLCAHLCLHLASLWGQQSLSLGPSLGCGDTYPNLNWLYHKNLIGYSEVLVGHEFGGDAIQRAMKWINPLLSLHSWERVVWLPEWHGGPLLQPVCAKEWSLPHSPVDNICDPSEPRPPHTHTHFPGPLSPGGAPGISEKPRNRPVAPWAVECCIYSVCVTLL